MLCSFNITTTAKTNATCASRCPTGVSLMAPWEYKIVLEFVGRQAGQVLSSVLCLDDMCLAWSGIYLDATKVYKSNRN